MTTADSNAEWIAKVDQDIATLKAHQVRPLAIVRRLEEAKHGPRNICDWPAFQLPGRGISQYHEEAGVPTVVLEFRHRAHAKVTEAKLRTLKKQFVVIESLDYREFGTRDGAAVYLYLKPRDAAQPKRSARSGQSSK